MFYQERDVNMQDKSSAAAYASDEGTEEIVIQVVFAVRIRKEICYNLKAVLLSRHDL